MKLNLLDEVALVTGAGRGIGAATALRLYSNGAKILLMSRSEDELKQTITECQKKTGRSDGIDYFVGDVSSVDSVEKAFVKIELLFGPVTILVNNAATFSAGKIEEIKETDWKHTFDVNVHGIFLCCQQAVRQMKKSSLGGTIINISSLGGISGTEKFAGFSCYSATKFAVVGLTEVLAAELKEEGIRVNCVAPGAVATKMLKEAAPFLQTKTQPEDIAKVIEFLANKQLSGAMTGATLPVYSNL